VNWLFWSPFLLGVYVSFGLMVTWKLYMWHVDALRLEQFHDMIIDAEFYSVD